LSLIRRSWRGYTDKKEYKIFLIYKEIQMGSGAKPYMRKGFFEEMRKFFPIYEEVVRHIRYYFAPDPSEFPYI
jgi:hypothetical protein